MRNTVLVLGMCLLTGSTFLSAQQRAQLDTTTFVVLGEGLAAGMANYGLSEAVQDKSFPAQMARQMETAFPQPLMQAPGIGDVLGYPPLPVRLPAYPQNRVRIFPPRSNKADEAPTLFVFNLSIPNLKVHESLTRRPMLPLIHENDAQQTLINMILGFPSLLLQRDVPLWTQFEYAVAMFPTFALLELGYSDVLEAAVHGDPNRIPDAGAFRSSYARVVEGLRDLQAQVLVTTIPDPLDTGYFLSPERAAELMGTSAHLIQSQYDLATEDRITRNGLTAIGNQLIRGKVEPLPDRSVLKASVASEIRDRVRSLNEEIRSVARENAAVVYDLNGFFRRMRTDGIAVGSTRITGEYLGGFYSLDGYYPGATGHALIANEILSMLNATYGVSFPLLDLNAIIQEDPVAQYQVAGLLTEGSVASDSDP